MKKGVWPHSLTVTPQFHSHKSVQKLFHNLLIVFSNSLMGFKVICQLERELANVVAKFMKYFLRPFL